MRIPFGAVALVTLAVLSAGCKKGPDLVGKWSAQQGAATVNVEFKPDNTFSMGTSAGKMTMTAKGDYKVDGEKLTLTTKDLDIPGLPPAFIEKAKQSPDFSKPKDVTLKFVSDDEVSLSGLTAAGATPTQAVTLKRVKE